MKGSTLLPLALGLTAIQALPTKTTLEQRTPQIFGPPTTTITPGDGGGSSRQPPFGLPPWASSPPTGDCDWTRGPCILFPGPHDSNGWPEPKVKRQGGGSFHLPPSSDQSLKDYIARLERKLEQLQNKPNKSDADWDEIDRLHNILSELAGVDEISAPPGSSSTFTPGKRQAFQLPGDPSADGFKDIVAKLELRLEKLQNEVDKTDADWDEIRSLEEALQYIAGVSSISAPPGSSTTFTPGK